MNPDSPHADPLARRMEALERSNRRWRGVAALALSVGAFVLLVQVLAAIRPDPRGLEAQELVLRDVEGVVRARLGMLESGAPELELHDAQGRERARLSLVAEGEPNLLLRGADGRVRTGLGLQPDGRPQLALIGPPGVTSALLTVSPNGEDGSAGGAGRLFLRDGAGAASFQAP